jgi:HAD superfamily hydrolase (TIGR01509 family)
MNRKLKAVIFDMDGVLVDSEPFHQEAERQLHRMLGIVVPDEMFMKFVGLSMVKMWEILKAEYQLEQPVTELLKLDSQFRRKYFLDLPAIPVIEGVWELLITLTARGVPIALASSTEKGIIQNILHTSKLEKFFKVLVSGEEVAQGKPAPDVFLKAAELIDVKPQECMVIEDSRNGVIAAKRAGMYCVGFQNPESGNQDLSAADKIVKKIELEEIIMLIG